MTRGRRLKAYATGSRVPSGQISACVPRSYPVNSIEAVAYPFRNFDTSFVMYRPLGTLSAVV
jgi:hypothetical protein